MKIWKYPSNAALLINCCWSSLYHKLFLNIIAPSNDLNARSPVYNQMAFVIARNDFDGLHQLIARFFLCPQLIWILLVFLLGIHCIAPRWSIFQGVSISVDVISIRDFANLINVLPVWQSCSGVNSHISKIMSIQSLVVEMKSERCLFLKVFFLKFKLLWSKTQHTLFNAVLWLSCILKTEMTRCKIKMTFLSFLCLF